MASKQKKIIVVEDEPDTAEMFAEMMRLNRYQVLKAYGSTTAMSLIVQEKPDAVVLDIMMPDVSGLEVLHFIRRDPTLASIPVVVVSAKGLLSDIKTGLDAGATTYLTKPVAYLELIKAVEEAIHKSGSKEY
jgi:DNA-binding response OmpR family regulator